MGAQQSTERHNAHDENDITSESSTGAKLKFPENSRAPVSPRPPTAAPAASPSQLSDDPANSTPALSKSQSARKGRAKHGIDERRKSKPEKMVTSPQTPETQGVARKRHEEQELVIRRHETAITAQIQNLPPPSSQDQQRPDYFVKVPVGSGNALGPYGPTRDVNSWNGDHSKSRPYGPTKSVNFAKGDESESRDLYAEKTDVAAPKLLDGNHPKHADETVANRKTPVKGNLKIPVKAKRSPVTPRKYSGRPAHKAKKAPILFPGLVKYMGPSGFREDPDSEIVGDGPIKRQVSQDDETVANLRASPNGGPGEASTKSPAKVLGQTSAVSGKARKPQHGNIIKQENAGNTSARDFAELSTPSTKAEMPEDDKSLAVDDGIRRSGRARKIRRWDGENYEVRPSKQARRLSPS